MSGRLLRALVGQGRLVLERSPPISLQSGTVSWTPQPWGGAKGRRGQGKGEESHAGTKNCLIYGVNSHTCSAVEVVSRGPCDVLPLWSWTHSLSQIASERDRHSFFFFSSSSVFKVLSTSSWCTVWWSFSLLCRKVIWFYVSPHSFLFRFFSCRILGRVPWALQQVPVGQSSRIRWCAYDNPNPPSAPLTTCPLW